MSLFDLFKETKISKTPFKLQVEEVITIKPSKTCTFYLEGKGVNCNIAVKKEDEIEIGQILGKEKEDLSIPVLSSVKGKVLEVKEILNTEGRKVKAVVVEVADTEEVSGSELEISSLNKEDILTKLQEFALCDLEGIPLSLKYRAFSGNKILVKGFSSEPNFVSYELLAKKEKEINKAIEVIKALLNNVEIKVASEMNIALLQGKKPSKSTLDLKREALVKEYFGAESKVENVLIEDLHTLVYIGECFLTGQAHLKEYVVVSGGAIKENKLVRVKIGTSLEDIFTDLNGNEEELRKIVLGGVLRGTPQISTNVAVVSNTIAISCLDDKNLGNGRKFSCIRCAKCLRACPEGLNPIKLAELWEIGEKEEFLKFGGRKCIECGLCSYVCPSKIEVANKIATAKAFIK